MAGKSMPRTMLESVTLPRGAREFDGGVVVPHVFVSSTIRDLGHLRDAIRETLIDLGYVPMMSEYGDVGYLPTASAEESCYLALRQCQLAIFIIGKRYGSPAASGLSVTHSEFRTARDQGVPAIFLVDQDVLTYKRVFDENAGATMNFPGMEQAPDVFGFLTEISGSPVNNGLLSFTHAAAVRAHIKMQIAHFVGDLLRRRGDPIATEIKDILSEVKTLRHEMTMEKKSVDMERAQHFMRAIRILLEDRLQDLRTVVEFAKGSLEEGVPILLESSDFSAFVQKALGRPFEILATVPTPPSPNDYERLREFSKSQWKAVHSATGQMTVGAFWALRREPQRGVVVSTNALADFEAMFTSVRQAARGTGFSDAPPPPGSRARR